MSATPEPKVVTESLVRVLNAKGYYDPKSGKEGLPLAPLAERAGTSVKTLSKALRGLPPRMDLGIADSLCVAVDAHISDCILDPPDG